MARSLPKKGRAGATRPLSNPKGDTTMSAAIALHPKATTERRQAQAEACPVAALADEAADLVAAWQGLRAAILPHRTETWIGLAEVIGEPAPTDHEEEVSARAVLAAIRERLEGIQGIALHRRAVSAKGAAFQALILNLNVSDLHCLGLEAEPTPEQRDGMEKSEHAIERGLTSIVHYLASADGELPPHLIKHYMMAAHDQPASCIERAVTHFRQR